MPSPRKTWRVELWTINGHPTGYRVVSGTGADMEIAKGFTADRYAEGSFKQALADAEALAKQKNAELASDPLL